MQPPSACISTEVEEGGPQKRIHTVSKRTLVIRTASSKFSPALLRWLSESPAEQPWNGLHCQHSPTKSKALLERLDELLTHIPNVDPCDGPSTTQDNQRYSWGHGGARYDFLREPVLFLGRTTKTTVRTVVVADTAFDSNKLRPSTLKKSLSPARLDSPVATPNNTDVKCVTCPKKRARDDSDPSPAASKRLKTKVQAGASESKATLLTESRRPIAAFYAANTNFSEAILRHSDTKCEESAPIPTVCDPSSAPRDEWPAAPWELPSSSSPGFPDADDIASDDEDIRSLSKQDIWSPACSGTFSRPASTQPSTPGSLSAHLADPQELLSSATAFNSLLAAYGSQLTTSGKQQEDKLNDASAGLDAIQRCSEPSRKRPLGFNDKEHPGKGGSSDSEDESGRPTKAQKKSVLHVENCKQLWACPFHKFNGAIYANCNTWSSKPIGDVTRHVLASGHSSSPDMNERKAVCIRSLGKFATGEKRWKAIYSQLFDIPQDSLLIPSPYLEMTYLEGPSMDVPPAPTTLPHAWTVPILNEVPTSQSINLHASNFVAEATRLFEVFQFQSNALHVRRHQLRQQVEEMNAQIQAVDSEDQRLQLRLQEDLDGLNARFSQPGGLPLAAEQLHIPPDITMMLASIERTSLGPNPFQATVWDLTETVTSEILDGTVPESQAAGSSVAGDSGYGTMSTTNDTLCTCHGVWCFKCDKAGDNLFEGC